MIQGKVVIQKPNSLAAVIFSEIGGKKFESVPKLVAFAGLYPKFPKAKLMGHVCHKIISIIFAVIRDYVPAQTSP